MPISEDRLKMRRDIRKDQVEARDVLMCKLRDKIQNGYFPKDAKEFSGVLKMVSAYHKLVGALEECDEILVKLSEKKPMAMEKYGVECNGEHEPSKDYMEKTASGDLKCRFCGAKMAIVSVEEKVAAKDNVKKPSGEQPEPGDKKGTSMEEMFNIQ